MIYLPDGNLVLYQIVGDKPTAVWASDTAGIKPGKVVMQDDGNLVIYNNAGNAVWALWKEMPTYGPLQKGAYVGLDRVSGRLAYYAEMMKMGQHEFFIHEKADIHKMQL